MATAYRAFISYSHRDEAFARWLHRRVEGWRVPRDLVGRPAAGGVVPSSLRPVFRDRDDFSGAHSLREATMRALESSEAMIVICSPAAASSAYVDEEIRLFKMMGRSSRVIPIIVSGTPGGAADECFPAWLRREPGADGRPAGDPVEPIAADARDVGDGRHRAVAKVVAGLLGVPFDEIVRREERARRTRTASLAGAGLGAFVFATAFSAYALHQSYSANVAIEKSVFSIGGLVQTTNTLPETGPVAEIRRAMLREQCDLMDGLARGRAARAGVVEANLCFHERLVSEAAVLQEDGQATTGRLVKALCEWRERLWASLSADPRFDETTALAFSHSRTLAAITRGVEDAGSCPSGPQDGIEGHLVLLLERLDDLGRKRTDHETVRSIHEEAMWRLVELREQRQDWTGSAEAMRAAADLRRLQAEEVASESVHPASMQLAVYQRRLAWLAAHHLGDFKQAEADARDAVATWTALLALQPDHDEATFQFVVAREVLAEALIGLDRYDEALEALAAARDTGRQLLSRLDGAAGELRADLDEELGYIEQLIAIWGAEEPEPDLAARDDEPASTLPLDINARADRPKQPRRRATRIGPRPARRGRR